MKVGDLVRYRDRLTTDPSPPGSWGRTGVVIELTMDRFGKDIDEPAVEYMTAQGDFICARQADLGVINESW